MTARQPPIGRIGLLLFGSGLCALVYQIAWLRLLRLIFGGSTAASAIVVAIFMAGLGAGGLILGRRGESSRNPLAFYANLEIGISLLAAVSVFLIAGARWLYVGLGGTMALGTFGGTLLRLVLATLVLGVPTFLMGGTLPATVRAATRRRDLGRHTVGLLYAVNTVGAVAGALVTTFLLLELVGIRQTLWLAAAVNLLIALAARNVARGMGETEVQEVQAATEEAPADPGLYRRVLVAAAVVGCVFFLMELVWYRMMAPILGGSTYTFGVVLAVALAGIGIGGFLYGLAVRNRQPTALEFVITSAIEAIAIAIPFAAGDRLAFLALQLRDLSVAGFGALATGWTFVTCLVVLPAAVAAGYQFPLLVGLLGRGRSGVALQVGHAYAWNTFGAIAGSIAGGFGLIPLLSAPTTWRLSIWLLCALALWFLAFDSRVTRRRAALPVALVLAALALSATTGPTAFWRHSGIGAGRLRAPLTNPVQLKDVQRSYRRGIAWQVDGRESSVAMVESNGYAFVVNGKADGSARPDAPTQVMSGLVGAALHPSPKKALVVGLGTGSSAGWLARVPTIERVDVVELEPAILRVARDMAPVNEDVLDNPKVRVIVADAREILLTSRDRYDVIFSEPSNPYRAGISSLFTQEFYEAVNERLTENGLFLQWLQAYEIDSQVVRTAYATLASVFSNVETWQVHRNDLLLVASQAPVEHGGDHVQKAVTSEPIDRALDQIWGVQGLEGFYSGFVANSDFTRAIAGLDLAAINTDDHPLIEFGFARSVGRRSDFHISDLGRLASARGENRAPGAPLDWNAVDESVEARRFMLAASPSAPAEHDDPARRARSRARSLHLGGDLVGALRAWLSQDEAPRRPADALAMAEAAAEAGDPSLPDLVAGLGRRHAIEAAFIEARWHYRLGRPDVAVTRLAEGFSAFRSDPWPVPAIAQRALTLARELGGLSPELNRQVLDLLAEPFSVRLLEQNRLAMRAVLSYRLKDQELCAQTFSELEPHAPWTQGLLSMRRDCYRATAHPLTARAERDLDDFFAATEIPLWRDLLATGPTRNLDELPAEVDSTHTP